MALNYFIEESLASDDSDFVGGRHAGDDKANIFFSLKKKPSFLVARLKIANFMLSPFIKLIQRKTIIINHEKR